MLNILNNGKVYLFCLLVIFLVGLYFFVNYQTKEVLKHELKKMSEKKHKKQKLLQLKHQKLMQLQELQQRQQDRNRDMDSYIDPGERYIEEQAEDRHPGGYERSRLSKEDFMMRDVADGIH